MYVRAYHVYRADDPTSWYTVGGHYHDTLVRSADGPVGWLLTGLTLAVLWRRGDPGIMTLADAPQPGAQTVVPDPAAVRGDAALR